jgi:hypothetical protein
MISAKLDFASSQSQSPELTAKHSDSLIVVSGEASLDTDGLLHGWCWCTARPGERRVVEIMINDRVASAIVASRFRDDLRERNIGDGYHGFAVALTNSLTLADPGCVLSLRDRASGEIFWRETRGERGLPEGLPDRIANLAALCRTISQSRELSQAKAPGPALKFAARLGHLGRYLERPSKRGNMAFRTASSARASLLNGHATTALPFTAAPQFSVVLDAGEDASETMRAISAASPDLHFANAELLVLDSGADPRTALLPSIFPNLRYFANHGEPPAGARRHAAMAASAEMLIFVKNAAADESHDSFERAARFQIPAPLAGALLHLAPRTSASSNDLRLVITRSSFLNRQPKHYVVPTTVL